MKLLNTFAFVSILGASVSSLVAACGGSSNTTGSGVDSGTTPFDGGGASTTPVDGSTNPTPDGASSEDAAPGCTQGSCGTGQVCCQGATGSTCIAEGATCQGLAAQCTNSATCSAITAGQICCGTLSIASQSATSVCQAGPCASGSYELCTQSDECTGGDTCQPITIAGFQLPIDSCQPAPADGGASDGGTPPVTDASDDAPG